MVTKDTWPPQTGKYNEDGEQGTANTYDSSLSHIPDVLHYLEWSLLSRVAMDKVNQRLYGCRSGALRLSYTSLYEASTTTDAAILGDLCEH